MKFHLVIAILILLSISSCEKNSAEAIIQKAKSDTIIGTKEITNELPGSNYRKRAKGYFLIVKNDTSKFMPIACETNQNDFDHEGEVWFDFDFDKTKSYREQMNELSLILPHISRDFELDSLKSIRIGRLIKTGDLAVNVTKQLQESLKTTKSLENYKRVSELLKQSQLGNDFNVLLKPYMHSVESISIEKVFFTNREELYWASKVVQDSSSIPEKILDCLTWIQLKKKF